MALMMPSTDLCMKLGLRHLGIYLADPFQSVSSLDVASEEHIFTFTKISTAEKLHEFFLFPSEGAQSSLRICAVSTSESDPETETEIGDACGQGDGE